MSLGYIVLCIGKEMGVCVEGRKEGRKKKMNGHNKVQKNQIVSNAQQRKSKPGMSALVYIIMQRAFICRYNAEFIWINFSTKEVSNDKTRWIFFCFVGRDTSHGVKKENVVYVCVDVYVRYLCVYEE